MLTCWYVAQRKAGRLRNRVACLALTSALACTAPPVGSFRDPTEVPPIPPAPPVHPRVRALPPEAETPSATACPGLRTVGGWCWENPLPQGNTLMGAWAAGPDDLWLVGAGGVILHWDGKTVSFVPSEATEADDLSAIWGTAPNDIWVVGGAKATGRNITQHWDGARWQAVSNSTLCDLLDVWGSSPNDYWAIGSCGTDRRPIIIRWDGTSWQQQPYGGLLLYGVWGSRSDDVWFVGAGGQISHWNGSSLTSMPKVVPNGLGRIWGSGPRDVWAAGDELIHFDGTAWIRESGTGRTVHVLSGTRGGDVWISDDIRLLRGVPGAWTDVVMGDAASRIVTLRKVGSEEMWGAGGSGRILRWRPAGAQILSSGSDRNVYALWGSSPTNLWAAAYGVMLHGDGRSWTPIDIGDGSQIFAVHGSSHKDVWAASCRGTLSHFDGMNWTVSGSFRGECWKGVWASAENDAWASSDSGTILHWDGISWKGVPVDERVSVRDIWGSGPQDVWFAGGDESGNGIVQHWDGTSIRLAWRTSGGSFNSIFGSSPRDIWVAGFTLGHFNGVKWQPEPGLTRNSVIYDLWGSGPDDIWAVGFRGELRHWDGKTWSGLHSDTGNDLQGVFGFGRDNVRIAGLGGVILRRP